MRLWAEQREGCQVRLMAPPRRQSCYRAEHKGGGGGGRIEASFPPPAPPPRCCAPLGLIGAVPAHHHHRGGGGKLVPDLERLQPLVARRSLPRVELVRPGRLARQCLARGSGKDAVSEGTVGTDEQGGGRWVGGRVGMEEARRGVELTFKSTRPRSRCLSRADGLVLRRVLFSCMPEVLLFGLAGCCLGLPRVLFVLFVGVAGCFMLGLTGCICFGSDAEGVFVFVLMLRVYLFLF